MALSANPQQASRRGGSHPDKNKTAITRCVWWLLTSGDQLHIVHGKIGGEGPVGLGAQDESYRGIDAGPVFDGDLQGNPVTADRLGIDVAQSLCDILSLFNSMIHFFAEWGDHGAGPLQTLLFLESIS